MAYGWRCGQVSAGGVAYGWRCWQVSVGDGVCGWRCGQVSVGCWVCGWRCGQVSAGGGILWLGSWSSGLESAKRNCQHPINSIPNNSICVISRMCQKLKVKFSRAFLDRLVVFSGCLLRLLRLSFMRFSLQKIIDSALTKASLQLT